jgi:crossover junction endodeoxyribonuclease RusA
MITLELPYPVSMNQIWRVYKGRQVQSKDAIRYKNEIKYICSQRKVKLTTEPVSVVIELRPKLTITGKASKVVIDLDNCLKATLDALQGIVFANDKQVKRIYMYYGEPVESGALLVTIEQYE